MNMTMTMTTTATLLPTLVADQINHVIDLLVELKLHHQQGTIGQYQFIIDSERLHSQLTTLRQQQAEW